MSDNKTEENTLEKKAPDGEHIGVKVANAVSKDD